MKGLELLQKNPNVAKLICSYYLEIMLESLKDEALPEEFKDSVREQGIDNEKIGAILDGNPRNLFDFFDSHKIYPNVVPTFDGTFFCSIIIGNTSETSSKWEFNTRKEADTAVIKDAILELEERLTDLVSDKENG